MQSPYASPVEVCNSAILQFGGRAISSLSDTSAEARILNARYDPVVLEMLTKHAWTFAQKQADMPAGNQRANSGEYEFTIPSDATTLRWISYKNGPPIHVETIEGDVALIGTQETLTAHYTYRAPETLWPGDFSEAVVQRLVAELMSSLLNDFRETQNQKMIAEKTMRQAMVRDRRQMRGPSRTRAPLMVRAHRGVFSNASPTHIS